MHKFLGSLLVHLRLHKKWTFTIANS